MCLLYTKFTWKRTPAVHISEPTADCWLREDTVVLFVKGALADIESK